MDRSYYALLPGCLYIYDEGFYEMWLEGCYHGDIHMHAYEHEFRRVTFVWWQWPLFLENDISCSVIFTTNAQDNAVKRRIMWWWFFFIDLWSAPPSPFPLKFNVLDQLYLYIKRNLYLLKIEMDPPPPIYILIRFQIARSRLQCKMRMDRQPQNNNDPLIPRRVGNYQRWILWLRN